MESVRGADQILLVDISFNTRLVFGESWLGDNGSTKRLFPQMKSKELLRSLINWGDKSK
jgi:hypothetical protein